MKLLLTSGGLENESIQQALRNLVGRPLEGVNLAFIPTASNLESGDKWWLIGDLNACKKLGFNIDIVDVSALPREVWQKRLEDAEAIFVEGGNTFHLMHWVRASGLQEALPQLLKTRVYIGVSAGSMITGPSIRFAHSEQDDAEAVDGPIDIAATSLVDFFIEPHINNQYFPELTFEYVQKEAGETGETIYALDDQSAVQVVDGEVSIVSEGEWQKFN